MATFVKINDFVEALAHKLHDLESDTLTVALSNTAPGSESPVPTTDGNGVLANVTQIDYSNLSSRAITIASSAVSSGTYKLTLTDLVLTASGGAVGQFRYVYIYNDTAGNDELIGYYDYGSAVDLADGDTFTIDFDGSAGVLTLV
jgi:pyruvate/2-oxoglutarate dehydrogenase complex dihydrolipoamide acyltransferase (E2) component